MLPLVVTQPFTASVIRRSAWNGNDQNQARRRITFEWHLVHIFRVFRPEWKWVAVAVVVEVDRSFIC